MSDALIRLFSYGTLQQPEVQRANYGRLLDGTVDALRGYRLESLTIDDPEVVRISGKSVHTIARSTGQAKDRIRGTVYAITEDELAATDAYEADGYIRAEIELESGTRAFVYIAR